MGNITRPRSGRRCRLFVAHCEARIQQVLFFNLFGRGHEEAAPTRGGKPTPQRGGGAQKPPALEGMDPPCPNPGGGGGGGEGGAPLSQGQGAGGGGGVYLWSILSSGDFHPRPLGQQVDSIYVGQVLHIHDKGDHLAPLPQPKQW